MLSKNDDDRKSSWRDLFCGEDKDNNDFLDISRVQMFYFTFILVLTYAFTIGAEMLSLGGEGMGISELPPVSAGMLALLGISHSAYLGRKSISPGSTDTPTAPGANS